MFRKPHTASAHLVCKTRRVEAHFQSNVVEKAPSGSAAVAAGHLNPPTPRDRRAGRQGGPVKGTVSLHSCKREMGGWGAETYQEVCWLPELVLPLRRFAIFRLGGRTGRPRVPEGDSGGLPELSLGSPKVILELPGGHF